MISFSTASSWAPSVSCSALDGTIATRLPPDDSADAEAELTAARDAVVDVDDSVDVDAGAVELLNGNTAWNVFASSRWKAPVK